MAADDEADDGDRIAAAAADLARVVRACLAEGLTVEAIGARLGIPPSDVAALAARD